jgi:hypothetical protein
MGHLYFILLYCIILIMCKLLVFNVFKRVECVCVGFPIRKRL